MHGAGTGSKGISMALGFRFASLKECCVTVFGHLYRTSPTFRYAFGPVANELMLGFIDCVTYLLKHC